MHAFSLTLLLRKVYVSFAYMLSNSSLTIAGKLKID